jgi:hypothetical protein
MGGKGKRKAAQKSEAKENRERGKRDTPGDWECGKTKGKQERGEPADSRGGPGRSGGRRRPAGRPPACRGSACREPCSAPPT